jgi:hypothetical protein
MLMNNSKMMKPVMPGIWKNRLGKKPESFTPVNLRVVPAQKSGLRKLPALEAPPIDLGAIRATRQKRGLLVELPLGSEEVYGFGLQLKSFRQTGKKKTIRVNSDPGGYSLGWRGGCLCFWGAHDAGCRAAVYPVLGRRSDAAVVGAWYLVSDLREIQSGGSLETGA